MGDVQWQIFAYIVSQVETPLVTAVTSVLSAFLGYVATPLKLALVVYVALTGIAMARGDIQTPGSVVIGRTIKIAIVVWLLTGSGAYQQWVVSIPMCVDCLPCLLHPKESSPRAHRRRRRTHRTSASP
jgi:type IV secretion system protein VirB6